VNPAQWYRDYKSRELAVRLMEKVYRENKSIGIIASPARRVARRQKVLKKIERFAHSAYASGIEGNIAAIVKDRLVIDMGLAIDDTLKGEKDSKTQNPDKTEAQALELVKLATQLGRQDSDFVRNRVWNVAMLLSNLDKGIGHPTKFISPEKTRTRRYWKTIVSIVNPENLHPQRGTLALLAQSCYIEERTPLMLPKNARAEFGGVHA